MIHPFIDANPKLVYLWISVLSLCIGSLLNVVIYRLPLMLKKEWSLQCAELLNVNAKTEPEPLNLFFPRSFCPQCHCLVKAWQNIPIVSFLLLRGKCHECKQRIPCTYPLIELLTLVCSVFAIWQFGLTTKLLFVLLGLWLLIPLVFIDLEHQLLPDSLTLSFLWLGLIANCIPLFTTLTDAVLSSAGAYLSLWLIIKIFYLVTGKIGMGNGDFKLFAAFGAWFGWMSLPLILLLSSISGTVVGLIYLKSYKKSKDTPIPFGPFLCLAGTVYLFYGPELMHWYLNRLT